MPKPPSNYFYIRRWRVVIMREKKELILVSPRDKIFVITQQTQILNGLPYFVIDALFFSGLIPDYLRY